MAAITDELMKQMLAVKTMDCLNVNFKPLMILPVKKKSMLDNTNRSQAKRPAATE